MQLFQRPARPGDPSSLVVRTPNTVLRPTRDGDVWFVKATGSLSAKVLKSKGWTLCVGGATVAPPPAAPPAPPPEPEAPTTTEAPEEASEPTVEAVEVEPEPEPEEEVPPEADLSVLDRSVKALRRALRTGRHDNDLSALLAAEEAGKTRSSAIDALNDRVAEIA